MSLAIRKDNIGQDINIGDLITWGDSSRYGGVNLGMVLKYTPKLISTSRGNVIADNCVVVTAQMKAHDPKRYDTEYEEQKQHFVQLADTKTAKPKMTYQADVYHLTQNQTPANVARTYSNWVLEVQVFADKKVQGRVTTQSWNCGAFDRHRMAGGNDYEGSHSICRDYDCTQHTNQWGKYDKYTKNGKLILRDRYSAYGNSDNTLTARLIKSMLGEVPETSMKIEFRSLGDLMRFMQENNVKVQTRDNYDREDNVFGEHLAS